MNFLLSEVADAVHGRLFGEDLAISSVSIDTRTLLTGDLYIAIKGQNFDGHVFAEQAKTAGAAALLVEQKVIIDLPQIRVKDSHLALAELAAAWKNKASVKTIAVTGSNGKTTVKEMIAAILAVNHQVLSTKGNFNNDIGVPLTLLRLTQQDDVMVIEMGANHAGEIAYSCRYATPDVAVITNIGVAHIEGFGSLEGVAKAKAEIVQTLNHDGIAILNKDDPFYPLILKIAEQRKVVSFGLDKTADIRAENILLSHQKGRFSTQFTLVTADDKVTLQLQLAGKHNVLNALAATASCLSVGVTLSQIQQGLNHLTPVTGRLQPRVGEQGRLIIDDTYNANPSSLKVALDVLTQCEGEAWVILGAFGEMGDESINTHREVGELIKSMQIVRLFAVGADAKAAVEAFGEGGFFFTSQEQLINALKKDLKGHETLLIKGSRAQKMERVVAALTCNFRV